MFYHKIITFVCLLLGATHTLGAQKKYSSLSFGVGQFITNPVSGNVSYTVFSRKDISQVSRFSPQLSLNVEYLFSKKWSIGLQLQYANAQSDRDTRTVGSIFGNSRIIESVTSNALGGESNFKYFYYQEEKCSFYLIGQLGVFLASENATTPGGVRNVYADLWLSLNGGTGIRYFFNDKFGVFGELSYRRLGPPHNLHFNGGVIMKI